MIWMIVCAVLASAGLLLIVWALLGWCVLPPRREAVTIYRLSASEPQLERQVRAFVWSRESGLAGGRLILAGGRKSRRRLRRWQSVWPRSMPAWNTAPARHVGSNNMEQESQMIQGTVLAVIYQNPENGYCVLKGSHRQGEAVTVVGVIP